jgi:hypothetical protein
MVAGTMRAAPYRQRSIATWSMPLSNGMMDLAELPLGDEADFRRQTKDLMRHGQQSERM